MPDETDKMTKEELRKLWPGLKAMLAAMEGGYGFMSRTGDDPAVDDTLSNVSVVLADVCIQAITNFFNAAPTLAVAELTGHLHEIAERYGVRPPYIDDPSGDAEPDESTTTEPEASADGVQREDLFDRLGVVLHGCSTEYLSGFVNRLEKRLIATTTDKPSDDGDMAEPEARNDEGVDRLSDDEDQLVDNYRKLTRAQRAATDCVVQKHAEQNELDAERMVEKLGELEGSVRKPVPATA